MAKSRPISKKVFVGGIDANLSKDEIFNYFSKFGNVSDLELPFDRANNKRREFCFVIFETEQAANQASGEAKQQIYGRLCDVKKATPQPIAQQQKRHPNMHQSFNGSQQSNHHSLVDSRNGRFYAAYSPPSISPSAKSVQSNYRVSYRSSSRSDGHRNSFSGRRSADSQYGHHERFGNSHGYNRKNGPPPHRQSERSASRQGTAGGQYQTNAPNSGNSVHHPAKNYNGGHHKAHPQQQQQQQQQPQQQIQGQYYDQLGQQAGFYGYGMPYEYYPQQYSQHQAHASPAGNQYQMHAPAEYFNQFALGFYQQQQSQQSALQQQQQQQYNPNAMNAFYTNYQSANPTVDSTTGTLVPPGQPQQPQPVPTNAADYQSLDERYYQDQQKQFENSLINAASYDKFGGSQDEINNYQQMINHNLLNVPFQGSLQQC